MHSSKCNRGGSRKHNIFASVPDHSGKPESRGSAFYLWLMQPVSIKQPFDKRLNTQCRNIQQYIFKLKWQSQYTSNFSNTQSKSKCKIIIDPYLIPSSQWHLREPRFKTNQHTHNKDTGPKLPPLSCRIASISIICYTKGKKTKRSSI